MIPISVPRLLVLARIFFGKRKHSLQIYFKMNLRRSERNPKPRTIWEEKGAPSAAKDPKITKQNARTEKKTALKPIVIRELLEGIKFNKNHLSKLPTY
jgi:hypothetical protein